MKKISAIAAFLLLAPWARAQETKSAESKSPMPTSGLLIGIAAGEVVADVRGVGATSGDSLRLTVTNQTPIEKIWTIAPGVVATDGGPYLPDMAIRRIRGKSVDSRAYEPTAAVQLRGGETATYILEAYSLDFTKSNPASTNHFKLSLPRELPRCVFAEAERAQPSTRALQAAIWLLTNKATQDQLEQKYPVTHAEYVAAQGIARICEDKLKRGEAPANPDADADADLLIPPAPDKPFAANTGVNQLPSVGRPAADGPILKLEAGAPEISDGPGERTLSIPIYYRWNTPVEARPRFTVGAMRFEGGAVDSAIVPGQMDFTDNSGAYKAVIEQNDLKGAGEMVYAVFQGQTIAADQPALRRLFENQATREKQLISNILRVPVNWDGRAPQPDAPDPRTIASAATPATPSATPAAGASTAPRAGAPRASAPRPPRGTPDATAPVEVTLPLKNGGVLRGAVLAANGRTLRMRARSVEFEFDSTNLKHTPAELLDEARKAMNDGRPATALQYAAVAALLLEDPSEAREIVRKSRGAHATAPEPAGLQKP